MDNEFEIKPSDLFPAQNYMLVEPIKGSGETKMKSGIIIPKEAGSSG